jgi:hypothetical protein
MPSPRLVILPLLLLCVLPAAAQSPLDKTSVTTSRVASQPEFRHLIAPQEFRALLPEEFQAEQQRIGDTASVDSPRVLPFAQKPGSAQGDQDNANCFYIRSYRVKRENPESDVTKLAGYSTCQPATRFQTKSAVEVLEIAPTQ